MQRLASLLFALCLLPAAAAAQPNVGRLVDSARKEIERGVSAGSLERVSDARALLERVRAADPQNGAALHYIGYARYREATLLRAEHADPRLVQQALADGITSLRAAADLVSYPETHAVLALIEGQAVAGDPSQAMQHGRQAGVEVEQALRLGQDNPRVWLARGITAFYAPAFFGGGPERAAEYFAHASELYAADKPRPLEPDWGRAETLGWLGQAYARLGRVDEARSAYGRALALDPSNSWISKQLVPALDRQGKAAK